MRGIELEWKFGLLLLMLLVTKIAMGTFCGLDDGGAQRHMPKSEESPSFGLASAASTSGFAP